MGTQNILLKLISCFFYCFSVARRILKAIDVPQTIFLLDSAVLAIDISQADLPPGPGIYYGKKYLLSKQMKFIKHKPPINWNQSHKKFIGNMQKFHKRY